MGLEKKSNLIRTILSVTRGAPTHLFYMTSGLVDELLLRPKRLKTPLELAKLQLKTKLFMR